MHNNGHPSDANDMMGTTSETSKICGFYDSNLSMQLPDFDGFIEVIQENVFQKLHTKIFRAVRDSCWQNYFQLPERKSVYFSCDTLANSLVLKYFKEKSLMTGKKELHPKYLS